MIVELFSGNGDIAKACAAAGMTAVTIDYDAAKQPDIVANVYDLKADFLRGFSFIWASPDCTTYSLAARGTHRRAGAVPVSEYAKQCDKNNEALVDLLKSLDIPFIIENPRAHFRNLPFMRGLYRCTVYYSAYGTPYSKPTDFFSNRPIAQYFNTERKLTGVHLDYCKRYGDFLGRCKIPAALINDIVKAITAIVKEGK